MRSHHRIALGGLDASTSKTRRTEGHVDYLIQDWTTLSLSYTQSSIIQAESEWMSFQPYADVVFWLEVRALVTGTGGSAPRLTYETAPARDESLFKAMVTTFALSLTTTPQVDAVILSASPSVPLARWVRWKLEYGSTAPTAGEWGATFRIHAVANAAGVL